MDRFLERFQSFRVIEKRVKEKIFETDQIALDPL